MKKIFLAGIVLGLFLVTILSGCGGETTYTPGQSSIYTVGSVSFYISYIPGTADFPIGVDDSGTGSVSDAYWMAETEVTYQLWKAVYDWAGSNGYMFANPGREGHDGGNGADPTAASSEPVTNINWRDAIVWCNALSEMIGVSPVYKKDGVVVKNSISADCDDVSDPVVSAKGFRLPTRNEWELAARWRTDSTNTVTGYTNPYFTKGDSAIGATAAYTDVAATQAVAWYGSDSSSSTHPVGQKTANALGLRDMSGNVWEWCFDLYSPGRVWRGGGWGDDAGGLRIGDVSGIDPGGINNQLGFRPVRTQ